MARIPELYVPEHDDAAREEGLVYIGDLMASHVLTALKQNCAPQGLGFLAARPVTPEEINDLHRLMSETLSKPTADLVLTPYIGDMAIRLSIGQPDVVEFQFDYWDGRPMKTLLRTGPDTDSVTLTGFQPFNPWRFDRYQDRGVAQKTVDALRATGDIKSIDVQVHEGGRTFERADEAAELALGELLIALETGESSELGERLARALDEIDKGRE